MTKWLRENRNIDDVSTPIYIFNKNYVINIYLIKKIINYVREENTTREKGFACFKSMPNFVDIIKAAALVHFGLKDYNPVIS